MNIILNLAILLFLNTSQNTALKEVEELYAEGRFKEARLKIEKIKSNGKNEDEILFYNALLSEDAEKSVCFFKEILKKYPQSSYCDFALYTIAQYKFLQGSYKDVILTLRRITASSEESKYYEPSCLWLAISYEALNDTAHALLWYKRINNSDTVAFRIAKESLLKLRRKKKSIYSIQIGSFQNKDRAKEFVSSFKEKGYSAWLATTQQEGKKYYRVLIGEFESKEKAQGFSKLFSEKEKMPYWIVKLKKLRKRDKKNNNF